MRIARLARAARALTSAIPVTLFSAAAFGQSAPPPGPPMGLFDYLVLTNCVHLSHQHASFHAPLWPWEAPTPVFPGTAKLKARTISAPDLVNFMSTAPHIIPHRMNVQLIGQKEGLGYQWTDTFIEIKEPGAPQVVHIKGTGKYILPNVLNTISDALYAAVGNARKGLALKVYPREQLVDVKLVPDKPVYEIGDSVEVVAEFAYPLPPEVPGLFEATVEEVSLVKGNGNVALPYPSTTQSPLGDLTAEPTNRTRSRTFTVSLPASSHTSAEALKSPIMQTVTLDMTVRARDTSNSCDLLTGETEKTVRLVVENPHYAPLQHMTIKKNPALKARQPATRVRRNTR